jgi:ABC-type nitrate/sulfonate/bicarbonate transport system substrate-binding protein/outer membrane protein OmpA-like peptidoglycan-associated protein
MNTETQAKKVAILFGAIIGLALLAGAAYKWAYLPWSEGKELSATGSESQYKNHVRLAADSFAGYAILRSDEMKNPLKRQGTRLEIKDDGADYAKRLEALKNGDADMAVFTIDSYLLAGAKAGAFPASIVMLIDESKGADAIVAYDDVPAIQALDNSKTKLVLTPNSPSEFLGRILVSQFSLPAMPEDWIQKADGVDDVYKQFLGSKGKHKAFVMWEPYVMKALQTPGAHVLFSSSELSGYIVDVLVAQRDFLRDNPKLVRAVVETYQRAHYSYQNQTYGMRRLIVADAKLTNSATLDDTQAQKLADGIQWKNTLDNYATFGLQQTAGVENLEDIIDRIAGVLVKTGAIERNPVAGKASTLFYNGILADLHQEGFHPGRLVNVVDGVGPGEKDLEAARSIPSLPALTDAQWSTLQTVGAARVEPLEFVRGSSRLSGTSESDLDELAKRLAGLPTSYVRVVGHARADGDPQANLQLANERAQATLQRLVAAGVPETRVRAEAAKPTGEGGESQSVTFVLGKAPY